MIGTLLRLPFGVATNLVAAATALPRLVVALAALCGALVMTATPAAGATVDLGPGSTARIAVDPAGTAYVTWTETVSGQDVTRYCRLPSDSSACATTQTFNYPTGPELGGDSGSWPLLESSGGGVLILDARCCTNYATKFVYKSTDGGLTFDGGTEVGDDNNSGASVRGAALLIPANALAQPDESIMTFGDSATLGLSFQATGTTGPPLATTRANVLTQGDDLAGSLAFSANGLIAAWTNIDDNNVYWRQWLPGGGVDVNDEASWTPRAVVDAANINSGSRLAGGNTGTFLAYNRGAPGSEQIVLRQFTGAGWGDPIPLSDTGSPNFFDLAQDAGGGLHLAWQASDGSLQYRFSNGDNPTAFSNPQTLLATNPNGGFIDLRLGVGTGERNWVTWDDGNVRALEFTPGAALPPPTRGETVNAVPVKGKVLVRLPAGAAAKAKDPWTRAAAAGFVPLESIGRQVPVGSTLDTRKGTVQLQAASNRTGSTTQSGQFSQGLFNVSQGRKNPLTTLSMTGGGLSSCSKLPKGGSPKTGVGAASKHRRSLFSNVKGRFRSRGRNSAATVRGTKFTVTDTCDGTLTKVKSGTVSVRDFTLRKTRIVRKGHRYFARAPQPKQR